MKAGDAFEADSGDAFTKTGRSLVIIDPRALDRECFAQSIRSRRSGMEVLHFSAIGDWKQMRDSSLPLLAVLLNIGGRKVSDPVVESEIRTIVNDVAPAPVILLADSEELLQILIALECGVKGYIPSSVGIDVCLEVINLALVGGIFVPVNSVTSLRHMLGGADTSARPLDGMFTLRQSEVVEALRRGKANKIIAYELNLRESTVKVHIRNIMKKLKATNRTEVAFKINKLFSTQIDARENWL
ncbi:response regulator transcription factor [Aureimonas leprariae]|uniref:Response regulator transcription factor n=2 Tax=Plantimonas leprariae TaxID=2615207 RepID=A0A7V7PQI1_9HYPH|nr:response regulator transcription factor [Aureimonas leprariae]